MVKQKIIGIQRLGERWITESPFLLTVYHNDVYPPGNEDQGVDRNFLEGRKLGEDFELRDGFRMYHGTSVPGFPAHPHKGCETVTIVLKGVVDHFDSTGSIGRYASGDVQWLTTGNGCQHSEMFPLVHQDKENPLELFQIWLNLSSKGKKADPEYQMFWREDIPEIICETNGRKATVKVIAGQINETVAPEPNPASWAKNKNNHVGIYLIHLEPGAVFTLPNVSGTMNRNLYYYNGQSIQIEGATIQVSHRCKLVGDEEITIENGEVESFILVLEGEPINEPTVHYGPFVMNTKEQIYETFVHFKKTQFGGWKWERPDPVNERECGRFARFSDGTVETPRMNERIFPE